MAEVVECSLDTGIAPAWILASHLDDQVGDDFHDSRPTRRASPVPTKNGVGSDERGNFGERPSSNGFAADSQSASLIVSQAKSSATELLPEDSVLLSEVFNNRILPSADPASQGGNEDLPRLQSDGHPLIVARQRNI